jgi:hypothetical protein
MGHLARGELAVRSRITVAVLMLVAAVAGGLGVVFIGRVREVAERSRPATNPKAISASDSIQRGYSVRVTPTEFFSAELRRLKPHLDFLAADAFKIITNGPATLDPDVEVWCDGQRVDHPKHGLGRDDQAGELTLTVRRVEGTNADRIRYRVTVGGLVSFQRVLESPVPARPAGVAFGPITIDQPIVLQQGTKSAVVWAMGGGDGLDLTKQESVDRQLEKLPWAIILRLSIWRQE